LPGLIVVPPSLTCRCGKECDAVSLLAQAFLLLTFTKVFQQLLKGAELLPAVYAGARYVDGMKQLTRTPQKRAA
ncbi:MAG: hypothetical protein AB1563_12030, partial [Bacillota bacterium]